MDWRGLVRTGVDWRGLVRTGVDWRGLTGIREFGLYGGPFSDILLVMEYDVSIAELFPLAICDSLPRPERDFTLTRTWLALLSQRY